MMHHRQTKGNEATLTITWSLTLKERFNLSYGVFSSALVSFSGGRGLIRGRVCGSAGVIKNKSRLRHILIWSCEVTERF